MIFSVFKQYKITGVKFVPLHKMVQNQTADQSDPRNVEVIFRNYSFEQKIFQLEKLLSAGIFYFANSSDRQNIYDLSHSIQRKRVEDNSDRSDIRFYWCVF